MLDAANGLADASERAVDGLAGALAGAAPGWLALAVGLHVANQVARGRGWAAIVAIARPRDRRLRCRHAVAAWVAGAGMGGVASARGGDAVRLLLLRQRLPGAPYPQLAGTLVAEAAGETAVGAGLVALLVASGLAPGPGVGDPTAVWLALGVAVTLGAGVALRSRSRWLRELIAGVAQGCAALRTPGAYARAVLPWQLTSRLLRAASLSCFLVAFGLPATPAAVALVMLAQGGGRLLPLAPASAAATVAVLAVAFPGATGVDVSTGALAGFVVGMGTLLTLVGVALAAAIAAWTVGAKPLLAALRPRWRVAAAP